MGSDLHVLEAWEIAEAVRGGRLSARDVTEHALGRIETRNPALGAFVFLDAERARKVAADVDRNVRRGEDPGPLAGVPIGVKELEDVRGWPHTLGSTLFADRIAETTSTQVARACAAGAVPLGLTASPELGAASFTSSRLNGVCRNPWNPELTPGGSSGGSAAAVAAGLVPLATGSDSGGSLRIPAAFCGLVGFKGTYGRIPRGPLYVGSPNIRNYGALTRTVRDTLRFLDCVVGSDEHDPLSLPHPGFSFEATVDHVDLAGMRYAWSSDLGFAACEPDVAGAAEESARRLASECGLVQTHVPIALPDPAAAWSALMGPDLHALLGGLAGEGADVPPVLSMMLATARSLDVEAIAKANHARQALIAELARVFEAVDVILLPTTSTPAFAAEGPMPTTIAGRVVEPLASVGQTYPFNLSGHPAVSVPAGMVRGAPVGLQIVGRRHEDLVVLAAAACHERIVGKAEPAP